MAIGTLAAALAENGEGSCLILDGGLGTELEKQGHLLAIAEETRKQEGGAQ